MTFLPMFCGIVHWLDYTKKVQLNLVNTGRKLDYFIQSQSVFSEH